MFGWLYNKFFSSYEPYEIHCVRVPSDGSPPHLVTLQTIDTEAEGNVDCFLRHTPDVRRYWRTKSGWQYREMCLTYVEPRPGPRASGGPPYLEGWYAGFKSYAMDDLPENKHLIAWGDAFIAKVEGGPNLEMYDSHGRVVYGNVHPAFLGSRAYAHVVERLASP